MSILDKLTNGASGSDFLRQVKDGFFSTDFLKDYAHASKLMRPNGLALAPKQKFLFHVFFTLTNPDYGPKDKGLIGALVKTVQLPSFSLDTEEYVQYNRKRLVHNRIKYDPITITLHDDGEDHVRDLWYRYYSYYFSDPSYEYDQGIITDAGKTDYNGRDIYNPTQVNQDVGWGKTILNAEQNGQKPAFFKDIKIFGFNRGNYVLYTLINPVITTWRHDTYDYADSAGVMQHEVQIRYEAVKYGGGVIQSSTASRNGGENIPGFAEESRYDTAPGALGPGSTQSTFGTGGLFDTGSAIAGDLASGGLSAIPGIIQKAGAAAKTFGSVDNLLDIVETDTVNITQENVLEGIRKGGQFSFPNPTDLGINKNAFPRKEE